MNEINTIIFPNSQNPPQYIKHFIMLDKKRIYRTIIYFILSLCNILAFWFSSRSSSFLLAYFILGLIFTVLFIFLLFIPFGMTISIDKTNKIMYKQYQCLVYGIYCCCKRKYNLGEIKEFIYKKEKFTNMINYTHEIQIVYKYHIKKDTFYSSSHCWCFCEYEVPLEAICQQLNNLLKECEPELPLF